VSQGGRIVLLLALVACKRSGAKAVTDAAVPATTPTTTATDAAAAAAPPRRDAGACLELDENEDPSEPEMELVGRLYVDESARHPNGVRLRPYILKLDHPLCLNDPPTKEDGAVDPYVSEVHVATMKRRPDLRPLRGTKIRVRGRPTSAFTAWHTRPVMFWATAAERITPAPPAPPPRPLRAGKHFGYIDAVDAAGRSITFDVATLYRGKAAVAQAKKRETLLGVIGGDESSTFVVDDDPTLRTIPLASDVVVEVLVAGDGSKTRARADLGFFRVTDAGEQTEPFERAWEITLKDGEVVRIDEAEL
jgi:hypothetical protein